MTSTPANSSEIKKYQKKNNWNQMNLNWRIYQEELSE
jgi:hypothetical protein